MVVKVRIAIVAGKMRKFSTDIGGNDDGPPDCRLIYRCLVRFACEIRHAAAMSVIDLRIKVLYMGLFARLILQHFPKA